MADSHEHPPIPNRVAEGVALFDRYYRLNPWYEPGRFTPDSPDATPPGISAIVAAMRATPRIANDRPDDPRRIRCEDGESYAQSPHLGMVPYPDEDPAAVWPALDLEWVRAQRLRRSYSTRAAAHRRVALPSGRWGVPALPQRPRTWWLGPRCVACDAGQWAGTTKCHRCGADQPGVAWAWVPDVETPKEWFTSAGVAA